MQQVSEKELVQDERYLQLSRICNNSEGLAFSCPQSLGQFAPRSLYSMFQFLCGRDYMNNSVSRPAIVTLSHQYCLTKESSFIDIGCRSGDVALAACAFGIGHVYGVDMNSMAVDTAITRLYGLQRDGSRRFDKVSFFMADFREMLNLGTCSHACIRVGTF